MRQEISIIFEQNRNRYGSPRVTRALRTAGKKVGENSGGPPHAPTAAGCPPQAGLSAQNHRGLWKWSAQPNRGRPSRSVPIRFGESDITYVATAEAWLYLAVILDLFSRRVLGWKLGDSLATELVETSLQNALFWVNLPAV